MKIRVRTTPNARRSEIVGWEGAPQAGRVLHVKIAAAPVDGRANEALREFLAAELRLPKSRVVLEKGGTARFKTSDVPDDAVLP